MEYLYLALTFAVVKVTLDVVVLLVVHVLERVVDSRSEEQ